jgi:hypothetical protein
VLNLDCGFSRFLHFPQPPKKHGARIQRGRPTAQLVPLVRFGKRRGFVEQDDFMRAVSGPVVVKEGGTRVELGAEEGSWG